MLQSLQDKKEISGIQFAHRGPIINHLIYADDTILFFKATPAAFHTINSTLLRYGSLAGQRINYNKSELLFSPNTPRDFKESISANLGVRHTTRLGKYLGVKIDYHNNKKEVSQDMVDKFQSKLSQWKGRLLSQAARITLAHSVLQSTPIYQFSSLAFPKKYTSQIDAITANFIWGFKNDRPAIHLASKARIFSPKLQGGLGLRNANLVNTALLAKHSWNFYTRPNSLLTKWVSAKYYHNNVESSPKDTTQPS